MRKRIDFALQSRAKPQGRLVASANPVGVAGRFGERMQKVRVTRVRDWPLCATCVRSRMFWFTLTQILFWGGLACALGALVVRLAAEESAALGIVLGLGFVMLLVSPVAFVRGSVPRLVQARTSEDGKSVVVIGPHPEFLARLRPEDSMESS